jgi:hypothetical protein
VIFVAGLIASALARPAKNPGPKPDAATLDPSRHIHIMRDDGPFKVRLQRGIPDHHPMMAAFYGMARAEVRA